MENHRYGCVDERLPIPGATSGIIWLHQGNQHDHPRHRHSALEMNLVVSGRGCYEVDGRRHALVPGVVLWIRPGESHYVEERTDDFRMWIIAAERPLLREAANSLLHCDLFPEHPSHGLLRTLPVDEFTWLEREVRRTYERATDDFLRAGIAYALVGAWESTRSAPDIEPGAVLSAPLAKALSLLERDASLGREVLAEQVQTTPERLGRLFRTELCVSFVEYRNRVRLQRFLDIQRLGRGTLLGACLEAGFGSYAQFHRVYTDVMGRPPSKSGRTQEMPALRQ